MAKAKKARPAADTGIRFEVEDAGTVSALLQRPRDAERLLVLAHGAGAGMRHAFMDALARGQYDATVRRSLQAARRDPDFAAYHFHAGVMQAIAYFVHNDRGDPLPPRSRVWFFLSATTSRHA